VNAPAKAFLSLHDVMPETFDRVRQVISFLAARRIPPLTLLVVPGREWSASQLEQLHKWSEAGHPLAAHGWIHESQPPRSLHHRLHSALLSRRVAEHLSLKGPGIVALMRRSQEWFVLQGLPQPSLYVPPAWALGPVARPLLQTLDLRWVESTRGFLHLQSGQYKVLPLVGYEADTAGRATFLRLWNRFQVEIARRSGRPLRISVHPHDLQLRLAGSLQRLLADKWDFIHDPTLA
jgi:predicted deacetylase